MNTTEIKSDVVVVGAGAAGVAAAIAAAREGLSVVLLEKNSFPGGRATASAVGTICGLYLRSFRNEATFVAEGFIKEFAEKLHLRTALKPQSGINGLYFLPYNPFDFQMVCDELLITNGIQTYYHATVFNAQTDDEEIKYVEAFVYDRKLKFIASHFIDCSGEASLCYLAGDTVVEEHEYQASAKVFTVENIETSLPESIGFHIAIEIKRAVNEGKIAPELQWISVVPNSFRDRSVMLKIGIPLSINNNDNKATEVELAARKTVYGVFDYLKNNVAVFYNSHISFIATEAGLRTGRRPMGKYTLTETDVLDCRKFDNSIANGAWPIEFWGNDNKVKMDYFAENDFYQIPEGCLESVHFTNLFFAGKNISATEKAIASARVIGTCLQTGWAAGKLAAK